METILLWLTALNDVLRIINPFLFIIATCTWIKLSWSVTKEMNRNMLKQYCIESQIDYIVNNRDIDREYIDHLRKIYSNFNNEKQ